MISSKYSEAIEALKDEAQRLRDLARQMRSKNGVESAT